MIHLALLYFVFPLRGFSFTVVDQKWLAGLNLVLEGSLPPPLISVEKEKGKHSTSKHNLHTHRRHLFDLDFLTPSSSWAVAFNHTSTEN